MALTNGMLVGFALAALEQKARYWYGTYGQRATASLYSQKKAQYPGYYTSGRAAQYQRDIECGAHVVDCIGLIKWFFWSMNGARAVKYADGFPDISADQCIAGYCDKTGSIGTLPEVPGLVLWCKGHIGVYIGDGWAIEARGFAHGVAKTRVSERSWTKWGRIKAKYLTYVDGEVPAVDTGTLGSRELQLVNPLVVGEDVRTLQKLLIGWGFSCGKWGADGEYGCATENAVIAWQYANGLPETGVVDADDFARIARLLNPEEGGDEDNEDEDETPEPEIPQGYVTVISGNTVNVRVAPDVGAAVLGIAYLGDTFEYLNRDSADGWHLIDFNGEQGWISGKYMAVYDVPIAPVSPPEEQWDAVIVDLDQHSDLRSSKNEWDKYCRAVDMTILRCGVTRTETKPLGIGVDDDFAYAAKQLNARHHPFGVYFYGKVRTAEEARKEARKAFETASPYNPLFYCYDVEENRLTNACLQAFAEELRRLGVKKVGLYVGHNYYTTFEKAVKHFDFVWIPRYGKNDGQYDPKYKPAHPCDVHQFTSVGVVPGNHDKTLDVNRLTGTKPLSWFLERA